MERLDPIIFTIAWVKKHNNIWLPTSLSNFNDSDLSKKTVSNASWRAVMAKNIIQFQAGYSLFELIQDYGTEEQCHQALYKWR